MMTATTGARYNTLYGIVAEFDEAEQVVHAATEARAAGYRKMDAYTPFPVHGLDEALEFHDARVPWVVFLMGLTGCCSGFALQVYTSLDYPWNVGGRPLISWPSFIPVTYECTILFAAVFGAVFGMLALNGFPRLHHPIFNAPRFELATQDKFFLCIEAVDPKFDREVTAQFLSGLGPTHVSEVEN